MTHKGPDETSLFLLGVNHTTAPLELRERLAFKADEAAALMKGLLSTGVFAETVLISTCNRTEIYGVTADVETSSERLHELLIDLRGISATDLFEHGYTHLNGRAAQHLFTVSTGIDSLVVGEVEILGQIKDAYRVATSVEVTGPFLNRLFQQCFHVGKRARSETAISVGGVSIGSIAVEQASRCMGDLSAHSVLLIGAGATAQLVAKHLKKARVSRITVTNRTQSNAEKLAAEFDGQVLPFDLLPEKLCEYDIVVTALGVQERVIKLDMLRRSPTKLGLVTKGYPLLIDLGVPRDVDPAIDEMPDVTIFHIDDLQVIVEQRLERRSREIPKVRRIVDEEAARFMSWTESLRADQTIKALRTKFSRLRQETLQKWQNRLNDSEFEIVNWITSELLNKVLSDPLFSLKGCELGDGPRRCASCEMFDLEDGFFHGHHTQELKCLVTRQLFALDNESDK